MDAHINRDYEIDSKSLTVNNIGNLMTPRNLKEKCLKQLSAFFLIPNMDLLATIRDKAVEIWIPKNVFHIELMLTIFLNNLIFELKPLR